MKGLSRYQRPFSQQRDSFPEQRSTRGSLAGLPAPLSWLGRGSNFLPRINKELQRLVKGVIQQKRTREAETPTQHSWME